MRETRGSRSAGFLVTDRAASTTSLARSAFGADAAGAGADDFVAAADRTRNAHEDAAERYCHAVR